MVLIFLEKGKLCINDFSLRKVVILIVKSVRDFIGMNIVVVFFLYVIIERIGG